jgi:hypothetical protein
VLVAIVKKRLNLTASLYEILQILSLTMFEQMPLDQLLSKNMRHENSHRYLKPTEFIRLTSGHYCIRIFHFPPSPFCFLEFCDGGMAGDRRPQSMPKGIALSARSITIGS